MSGRDLRAGLREIARRRALGGGRRGRSGPAAPEGRGRRGRAIPGGEVVEVGGRAVFTLVREVAEIERGPDLAGELARALALAGRRDPEAIDPGLRAAAGRRIEEIAVLDLETTGFWGCPIFLVGLLIEEEGRLVIRQLLARDYPEEPAILHAASRLLARRRLLVTFNGKSYDLPCFRERALVHGVEHRLDALDHVDVLHPARRRYREGLSDCRLLTLEREVVGILRAGDVPSAEIPAVYHAFAAGGDGARLAAVLHHSRVDLLTTARLLGELLS